MTLRPIGYAQAITLYSMRGADNLSFVPSELFAISADFEIALFARCFTTISSLNVRLV